MTNSKASQPGLRSEKLWLPSFLLLAQFLTITPVLLLLFADEQQRKASDGYATLLEGLDSVSFALAELENIPRSLVTQDGAAPGTAWQQLYTPYRTELDRILSTSTPSKQLREILARMDSSVQEMAKTESNLAGLDKESSHGGAAPAEFEKEAGAARSELLNAKHAVRLELSTTATGIAQKTTYLKVLVSGACLLAFGVVFVIRKFRIDSAIQKKLQQELRTTNEEVVEALAAARSESEAKNQYLAHVGHLMRTPLMGIVGGTAELLQTDLSCRQRECAQTSRDLAQAATAVAEQVIDYSKLESGALELQSIEFSPAGIVTEVVQHFTPSAERKGLKLKTAIGKGVPSVKGDPERLRQVLFNLVGNSVRFTQQGEVLIRVEQLIRTDERETLRFEIRDAGVGITAQVRNRIFQPFSHLDGSTTKASEGAGLGLAISKKLVESMGGKIEVASELGHGATFSFTAVFESVRASTEALSDSTDTASSPTANGNGTRSTVNHMPQAERKGGRERRAEQRHRVNHPTLLKSQESGIALIRVLDVSPSGLRVSAPFRLELQTEVEIRIEHTSVVGIVRNCTCIRAGEFHVGIEIPRSVSEDENSLQHLRLLRKVRVLSRN